MTNETKVAVEAIRAGLAELEKFVPAPTVCRGVAGTAPFRVRVAVFRSLTQRGGWEWDVADEETATSFDGGVAGSFPSAVQDARKAGARMLRAFLRDAVRAGKVGGGGHA